MEWKKVETYWDKNTGNHDSNVPYGELLVSNGIWVKFVEEHGWDDEEYYFHDGHTGQLEGVTHFMLLPEPPKKNRMEKNE